MPRRKSGGRSSSSSIKTPNEKDKHVKKNLSQSLDREGEEEEERSEIHETAVEEDEEERNDIVNSETSGKETIQPATVREKEKVEGTEEEEASASGFETPSKRRSSRQAATPKKNDIVKEKKSVVQLSKSRSSKTKKDIEDNVDNVEKEPVAGEHEQSSSEGALETPSRRRSSRKAITPKKNDIEKEEKDVIKLSRSKHAKRKIVVEADEHEEEPTEEEMSSPSKQRKMAPRKKATKVKKMVTVKQEIMDRRKNKGTGKRRGYEEDEDIEYPFMPDGVPNDESHDQEEADEEGREDDEDDDGEVIEPSPLDRRLKEGRTYNYNDWTSEELKNLYDGVTLYGTAEKAVDFISQQICGKPAKEVQSKVDEIRELVAEHRDDRMTYEKERWTKSFEASQGNTKQPRFTSDKSVHNWFSAVNKINRQHRNTQNHVVQMALVDGLDSLDLPIEDETVTVSDAMTSRGFQRQNNVNWHRIREVLTSVVRQVNPLPPLNPLEASIVLSMLDSVENEAMNIEAEHKIVMRGWMENVQMRDLRDFEPDAPCGAKSATQAIIDPLRTRLWGIPENGSEPTVFGPIDRDGNAIVLEDDEQDDDYMDE